MVTATTTARRPLFTVGDTLQSALSAVGSNFWSFTGVSLLVVGLPRALIGFLMPRPTFATSVQGPHPGVLVVSLVTAVMGLLLQAIIVRASVASMDGRRPDLAECARAALKVVLPLLGISVLWVLGILAGAVLLIVPGLFLMVAWSVVIPAEIVERVGVFAAFSRSWALTRGLRWPVFGVFLVMGLLSLLILLIGSAVTSLMGMAALMGGGGLLPVAGIVTAITASLGAVLQATTAAAVYFELRRVKEGVTPQSLAAVFD